MWSTSFSCVKGECERRRFCQTDACCANYCCVIEFSRGFSENAFAARGVMDEYGLKSDPRRNSLVV